jgi:molybdopterin-guanine dinucleotide biosynthesis protein A
LNGAILAGGGATRYDRRPKGLELVGGRRIIDRVNDALQEATGRAPILVANAPEAHAWLPGSRVVGDVESGTGALGGLLTAVTEAPAPTLCGAWDMPFIPAGLLRELAAGLERGFDAFLPASDGRRGLEPMCAAYGPACGPAIAAALARGDRRAIAFHPEVKVGILPVEQVRQWGDPAQLFFNVNTPDDLLKAEDLWRVSSRSSG